MHFSPSKTSTKYEIDIVPKDMRLKPVFKDDKFTWVYEYNLNTEGLRETKTGLGSIDKYIHKKTLPPDTIVIHSSHYRGETIELALKEAAKKAINEKHQDIKIAEENITVKYDDNTYIIDGIVEHLTDETKIFCINAPKRIETIIKNMYGHDTQVRDIKIVNLKELEDGYLIHPNGITLIDLNIESKNYAKIDVDGTPFYTNLIMQDRVMICNERIDPIHYPYHFFDASIDIIIEEKEDSTPSGVFNKLDKDLQSWLLKEDSHIKLQEITATDGTSISNFMLLYKDMHGGLKVRASAKDGENLKDVVRSVQKVKDHLDARGLKYTLVDPNNPQATEP